MYFTPCSSVSIVNFEHVIVDWDVFIYFIVFHFSVTNDFITAANFVTILRFVFPRLFHAMLYWRLVGDVNWSGKTL